MPSLAEIRIEHRRAAVDEDEVADDPVRQPARWFDEVHTVEVPVANAMTPAMLHFFRNALEREVRRGGTVALVAEFEAGHRGGDAMPPLVPWGGLRERPDGFAHFPGWPSRLHDRIAYRPEGERWRIERLAP